jgi:hypothetical protein
MGKGGKGNGGEEEGRGMGKGGKRYPILREGPCIPQKVPVYCFGLPPSYAYLLYAYLLLQAPT